MEPKIIFEDNEILVLDKPAGMIVNRADTTAGERTVQEWLENKFSIFNFQFLIKKEDSDFYNRAGIVHRLDKETSGILLVAKNPQSFENLQKQFKERKVKKTYIALVHGKVASIQGEINVPVGRLPWNRKRFGVLAEGRDAVTKYKVLRHAELISASLQSRNGIPKQVRDDMKEEVTLLELYPETGRTHQIRVHLKYFNHPVFSDPLYAGRKTARNDRKLLPRIFLHASKISFYHPEGGELVSFESPPPKELQEFLEFLRRQSYSDMGSVQI